MDKQILKDQIAGQIEKGVLLRADEALFLKVQGINETIVKTEVTRDKNVVLLEAEKENKKSLLAKKMLAVSGAAKKIVEKMNEVLPEKNAVFDCLDGLKFGMRNQDNTITAYNGLSGGQLQAFNAALANVLDANILFIEAAELDYLRSGAVLEDLANSDKQILISTCWPSRSEDWPKSYEIPENFQEVVL